MTAGVPFAELLWPDGGVPASYLTITRGGTVRSLLPADTPRVLRSALARSNGPETRRRHLARQTLARGASLRGRLGGQGLVEVADGGLRARLSEIVGTDVYLAVHFGPPRANRKPVIQALDGDGRLVAVAKLGVDDLTAQLVTNEAAALETLAGHTGVTLEVPGLVGLVTWSGRPLLVQWGLQVPARHTTPSPDRLRAAEHRIATLGMPRRPPVREYVDDLCARIERLPGAAPRDRWLATAGHVGDTVDLDRWPSAPWHGDWSPQNVAAHGATVAAWDWERFATGRPLGFDTAHFRLQQLLRAGAGTQPGVRLLDEAPDLLGGWQGRDQPGRARSVAVLLLLEMAARYLGDGQAGTGSPGAGVVGWVEPALQEMESRYGSTRGTNR